jgi:hypothetical protein
MVRLKHACKLAALYTLQSIGTVQKLFNASTNGALTLDAGVYKFTCFYGLNSMSATSGNSSFSLAGTATLGLVRMSSIGVDGAKDTAAAQDGSHTATAALPASQNVAAVNTTQQVIVTGMFEVTAPGTLIPSITLVTAAAAVVEAGSYFEVERVMSIAEVAYGDWS